MKKGFCGKNFGIRMNAKREKYIKETVLDHFWTVYNQQRFT